MTGGYIKNSALRAAFLAADAGTAGVTPRPTGTVRVAVRAVESYRREAAHQDAGRDAERCRQ